MILNLFAPLRMIINMTAPLRNSNVDYMTPRLVPYLKPLLQITRLKTRVSALVTWWSINSLTTFQHR